MKELIKALRHDTLGAIENGERLVTALGDEQAPGTDRLRKATKRFVRHLKEELTAWEDKYMRARGKQ
jgi:hypothetical protein